MRRQRIKRPLRQPLELPQGRADLLRLIRFLEGQTEAEPRKARAAEQLLAKLRPQAGFLCECSVR